MVSCRLPAFSSHPFCERCEQNQGGEKGSHRRARRAVPSVAAERGHCVLPAFHRRRRKGCLGRLVPRSRPGCLLFLLLLLLLPSPRLRWWMLLPSCGGSGISRAASSSSASPPAAQRAAEPGGLRRGLAPAPRGERAAPLTAFSVFPFSFPPLCKDVVSRGACPGRGRGTAALSRCGEGRERGDEPCWLGYQQQGRSIRLLFFNYPPRCFCGQLQKSKVGF